MVIKTTISVGYTESVRKEYGSKNIILAQNSCVDLRHSIPWIFSWIFVGYADRNNHPLLPKNEVLENSLRIFSDEMIDVLVDYGVYQSVLTWNEWGEKHGFLFRVKV